MSLYPFYDGFIESIFSKLVKAWTTRDKIITRLLWVSVISAIVAGVIGLLLNIKKLKPEIWEPIAIGLAVITGLLVLSIASYQSIRDQNVANSEIAKVEEEYKNNPDKPSAAWDLARLKLESYLNRNLSQVRWIFFWTVIIMIAGFIIISYGVFKVYDAPTNFQPSILVTSVGVVTELIGATFLIIYRSTMNQAKEYVNVLERINAVGMSMQVLESIGEEGKSKQNDMKAELAKELLKLYGQKK